MEAVGGVDGMLADVRWWLHEPQPRAEATGRAGRAAGGWALLGMGKVQRAGLRGRRRRLRSVGLGTLARLLLRLHGYPEVGAAHHQARIRRREGLRGRAAEGAALQSPRIARVEVHDLGERAMRLESVVRLVRVQRRMPRRNPDADAHLPWRGR